MGSFLGWVDHDPEHERSVLRALGSNAGRDARDELGLAAIRDSFADTFFPGLSTIQQRVRYFLFVQWCCELAARRGSEDQILTALWEAEVALIRTLTPLGEGEGVIGLNAQENLERMPSDVYWSGLAVLGMRRTLGSRRRWARQVVTAALQERAAPPAEGEPTPPPNLGFDPSRPPPPLGFPATRGLDFSLSEAEAAFLRTRLSDACIDPNGRGHEHNLMAPFSAYRRPTRVDFAWDHPRAGRLPVGTSELLALAAAFSRVMRGAMILYNRTVAHLKLQEGGALELYERHAAAFVDWTDELAADDVARVAADLDEVRGLAVNTRHRLRPDLLEFVRRWIRLCGAPAALPGSAAAVRLVSEREARLKTSLGASRIRSKAARGRWSGESGGSLDYRWAKAKSCLNDLAAAG